MQTCKEHGSKKHADNYFCSKRIFGFLDYTIDESPTPSPMRILLVSLFRIATKVGPQLAGPIAQFATLRRSNMGSRAITEEARIDWRWMAISISRKLVDAVFEALAPGLVQARGEVG
jgi:hypothetical protein